MNRMRVLTPLLCLGLWLAAPVDVLGQSAAAGSIPYPGGLTLTGGAGTFSLRDENISDQRYAGTLPYLGLAWARDHTSYVYHVGIELRQSDDIRNHTISSSITRLVLGQAFLYPLAPRRALGHDLGLFLGPRTDVVLQVNEQHLAVNALGYATSVSGLLSLGLQAEAILPLSERVTAHGSLRTSVLSLGIRAVDDEIDDASPVKPLTLLSGTDVSFELGARYHLSGRLSLRLAYLFQLYRVTAWNPIVAASDNLVGGLTWRF
jgi:hypothetical protein